MAGALAGAAGEGTEGLGDAHLGRAQQGAAGAAAAADWKIWEKCGSNMFKTSLTLLKWME